MPDTQQVFAPFSDEQIVSLNRYQQSGVFHDFTCGADHDGARRLVATREGWICPSCTYTQKWAWAWMANDEWQKMHAFMERPVDSRVVYGAQCVWWDTIEASGVSPRSSLPCCPHCGGVLFELENEAIWWAQVDEYGLTHPGYREMIEWSRGKCFPNLQAVQAAFRAQP